MVLKIHKSKDSILRQPCDDVVDFGHDFQQFIDNLVETMRDKKGIGLAAPQVGVSKKVFACEFEGDEELNLPPFPLTIICNPKIVYKSNKKTKMVEGCLSFPGLELLIERPDEIEIEGKDRFGKDIKIKTNGLYAKVLQHENDHLNSTLLIDHLQELKTIFIGTGTLGTNSLELLINDLQYNLSLVITGDLKVSGRSKNKVKNPILEIAKKYKIPTIITKNIGEESIVKKIKEIGPDIGIMADFGQIIPDSILSIPKYGIINIHPSLLPEYRGPSPIQQAILNGEKTTGLSLILTSNKMDAGDIISQIKVELSQSETSTILKNFLAETGASLLLNSIPYYIAGDLKPLPQKEKEATYTKLFKKDDGFVDKNTPATEVERKIRAFDIWPKVYTIVNNKKIQLLESHFEANGKLLIDRVKPEGKKEMTYQDYLRGYRKELIFDN